MPAAAAAAAPAPRLELFYGGRYFKGDAIRLCLIHAGLPFDDVRREDAGWAEFERLRETGALPFGQMPVLRVGGLGGVVLGQSVALCRLVGRLADPALELYPVDPIAAAKVDAILAQDDDMRAGFYCMNYQSRYGFEGALGGTDSELSEVVRRELVATILPRHLGHFEKLLAASPSGWLAGTPRPTIADFYMHGSFEFLCDGVGEPGLLGPFPAIRGWMDKGMQLPAVAAFAAVEQARASTAAAAASGGLWVCGGNYSYTANNEYDGNNLALPYPEALGRIASAGFTDTYLVPFQKVGPEPNSGPSLFVTGLSAEDRGSQGLPFGSAALTPAHLAEVKAVADAAGLRIRALLVPGAGLDSPDPVGRYKLAIDQAAALGISFLIVRLTSPTCCGHFIDWSAASLCRQLRDMRACKNCVAMQDFGLHGDDSAAKYIAMMRDVAPYAEQRGLAISMKLHDSLAGPDAILDGQVAIFDAIGHPAFGLCMDPGNIICEQSEYIRDPIPSLWPSPCLPWRSALGSVSLFWPADYTAASNGFDYRLPTTGLAEVAHCFNTMIVKDCAVDRAGEPNAQRGGELSPPERDGKPNVMVQPGEGLVDFDAVLRTLIAAGFDGPLCVEKVPGVEDVVATDANMAKACEFVRDVVRRADDGGRAAL